MWSRALHPLTNFAWAHRFTFLLSLRSVTKAITQSLAWQSSWSAVGSYGWNGGNFRDSHNQEPVKFHYPAYLRAASRSTRPQPTHAHPTIAHSHAHAATRPCRTERTRAHMLPFSLSARSLALSLALSLAHSLSHSPNPHSSDERRDSVSATEWATRVRNGGRRGVDIVLRRVPHDMLPNSTTRAGVCHVPCLATTIATLNNHRARTGRGQHAGKLGLQ